MIAVGTIVIGGGIGILVGAITGYAGGWLDEGLMRINDAVAAFPSVLLALVIISIWGTGKYKVMLALGIAFTSQLCQDCAGRVHAVQGRRLCDKCQADWCVCAEDTIRAYSSEHSADSSVFFDNRVQQCCHPGGRDELLRDRGAAAGCKSWTDVIRIPDLSCQRTVVRNLSRTLSGTFDSGRRNVR